MPSKRVFENWYFEYTEAEREFLDAKRNFEEKKRDICIFLFRLYADWCKHKFGQVLMPYLKNAVNEDAGPLGLFLADFGVNPYFRDIVSKSLIQVFEEKSSPKNPASCH